MNITKSRAEISVRILLVDDRPERLHAVKALLGDHATLVVRDPDDVSAHDLESVDLVSVDEYLGNSWEQTVDRLSLESTASIRNRDGLAVAAAFRSQARVDKMHFAVSLHTGDLETLSEGIPRKNREALTAAQHDLDWVFEFQSENFADRLIMLANAVRLATEMASGLQNDSGSAWLLLPGSQPWGSTARDQIDDCRPPAHGLSDNTSGRSFVRWFAQRILPYPAFLLDENHSANLLGLTVESFSALINSRLAASYETQYVGPLHRFLGRRWWRAALQQMLVDSGSDVWDSPQQRAQSLGAYFAMELRALKQEQAAVFYDGSGEVTTIDGDARSSVRLHPDGWPVFADDPRASRAAALSDGELLRLVSTNERLWLQQHSIDSALNDSAL